MPDDPMIDPFADASPRWMEGRTAIVTGGGQTTEYPGVGYAISRVLSRHGARIAVLDIDKEAAERTVEHIAESGGEAISVLVDVTDDRACADAIAEVVDRLGTPDALVNNVAAGDRSGLFDTTPEHYDRLMDINLKSAWSMTRHAVPVLPRGSSIVNISSVGVSRRGPGLVYCVAKAGMENMTEGAATTLGPQGIRVNCVQVGAIYGAFAYKAGMSQQLRERRAQGTALKTEGTPWDIAYAALYLLSDRARWVSGHILTVEGGPPHMFPAGEPITSVPMGG
jgi:NAD(P)-dependent dehydrogenase (short-subunit alcohol dehydrogenase family)